jgi:hypothetical protein
VDSNPVKTSDSKILATVYKKDKKAMVAIASWADQDKPVHLTIDWKALNIDPAKATIKAPAIKDFQQATSFGVNDEIMVPKGKGWLLVIE